MCIRDSDQLLPENIEFIHGPGCPVCVLPMGRIDACIEIASRPGVIFCTFGDAMRVPGKNGSLLQAKARGADVRIVYSPMDALRLAQQNPQREVVFFGLGFETTTVSYTHLDVYKRQWQSRGPLPPSTARGRNRRPTPRRASAPPGDRL